MHYDTLEFFVNYRRRNSFEHSTYRPKRILGNLLKVKVSGKLVMTKAITICALFTIFLQFVGGV